MKSRDDDFVTYLELFQVATKADYGESTNGTVVYNIRTK